MRFWSRLLVVLLLVLSQPAQLLAAVSPTEFSPTAGHHDATMDDAVVHENAHADAAPVKVHCDTVGHRHHDSSTHLCCASSGACCAGIAIPRTADVHPAPELMRAITRAPQPRITPIFLTGGIERPPRHTLV